MHEVSLCRDLIDMVEFQAKASDASAVKVIHLRLGPFSHISAEALDFCFSAVAEGTAAQGAKLVIVRTQAQAVCPQCLQSQQVAERFSPCVACGYFPLQVEQADDMVLQSIEVI